MHEKILVRDLCSPVSGCSYKLFWRCDRLCFFGGTTDHRSDGAYRPAVHVDEMLGEKTFSVTEAFHRLLSGEEVLSEESVREFLHSLLFYGIEREKELIVKLLLLLLFAAVFSGFAGAFDNGQVGEISFYVVYLLVFTLLMNSFSGLSASLLSMLAWITEFMKELSPVYFMAVAAASGASSAAAFYQGVLLLVWLFQWILERVLLPGVSYIFF